MILLNPRSAAALAHDILAAIAAWYLAFWLRFNTDIPQFNIPNMVSAMLGVVPLQAVIFFGAGRYRGMWRYASVPDLQRIASGSATGQPRSRTGAARACRARARVHPAGYTGCCN
jgi:hypothetical protein